jgi:toxin YoeB
MWREAVWEQYVGWQDRKIVARINELIKDISRNGHRGIGKPEALRQQLAGFWSRRITQEHRLVYRIVGDDVEIIACRQHYEK